VTFLIVGIDHHLDDLSAVYLNWADWVGAPLVFIGHDVQCS
jgi:hypothetical protein